MNDEELKQQDVYFKNGLKEIWRYTNTTDPFFYANHNGIYKTFFGDMMHQYREMFLYFKTYPVKGPK